MREQPALREPEPLRERRDGETAEPLHACEVDGFIEDAGARAVAFGEVGHGE